MTDASHPPLYSSLSTSNLTPSVLLNLVPLGTNFTFQQGHLGHSQSATPSASIQGDIQCKWPGSDDNDRPSFRSLDIAFRGVERSKGLDDIELTDQRIVLWGTGAPGGSNDAGNDLSITRERELKEGEGIARSDFPPSTIRFKLDLTPDLPHCIHLGTSSLEYTLTATLYPTDPSLPPITKCSPVHLVRSSPSGSLLAGLVVPASTDPPPSITPETLSVSDPIQVGVRLARTVFRRSEAIELRTRIEVPGANVVQEEGLRLRTVSAELVRIIQVGGGGGAGASLMGSDGAKL
ncbi:hypothetical protein P7C70_g9002, partial [Phenoliferia sp. Uapishka_3]